MLQHLQCTQFCALMTKFRCPVVASGSEYSYTPAGQNLCSGPANSFRETSDVEKNGNNDKKLKLRLNVGQQVT